MFFPQTTCRHEPAEAVRFVWRSLGLAHSPLSDWVDAENLVSCNRLGRDLTAAGVEPVLMGFARAGLLTARLTKTTVEFQTAAYTPSPSKDQLVWRELLGEHKPGPGPKKNRMQCALLHAIPGLIVAPRSGKSKL